MTKSLALGFLLMTTARICAGVEGCLITREEAESVLGVRVGAEQPRPGYGGARVCWYVGPADQSLRLELHRGGRRAYEAYRKAFDRAPGTKAQPVRAVGEEAVFHAGQLTVLSGDYFFVVAIGMHMRESDRLATSVALARKVLQRHARLLEPGLP